MDIDAYSKVKLPEDWRLVVLPQVVSTNGLALSNMEYLAADGLVLCALHQTGGRGRRGRGWVSVEGKQLQFSVVLHGGPPAAGVVGLMAGLAVAEAVGQQTGMDCWLKWPNDVLCRSGRDERVSKSNLVKVCGVLVEGGVGVEGKRVLVLGVGLNVLGNRRDYPVGLRGGLGTLSELWGRAVPMGDLFKVVLERLNYWHQRVWQGEIAACLDAWRKRAWWSDRRVRLVVSSGDAAGVEGIVEGINEAGLLQVRLPNGRQHLHASCELTWL